jgi:site-specific DNA-cytosine methylase
VAAGESLAGCSTPADQISELLDAGRKYRSFKYWDKVRAGSSESHITGQGFNAVKFDPRKPARTVRRNDGNLGMHGAMHWYERRRFSLQEFKRFGSFPG